MSSGAGSYDQWKRTSEHGAGHDALISVNVKFIMIFHSSKSLSLHRQVTDARDTVPSEEQLE